MSDTRSRVVRRLTTEQVARFHREGFLALERITTATDVARIRRLLDGLFARAHELPREMVVDLGDVKHHAGAQRIPQINNTLQFEPRLRDTRYFRNAERLARQLLGASAALQWDHAIYKSPQGDRATPWHQDLAYPARSTNNPNLVRFGCNFWMPLQETAVEMGCMQFIPFGHLGNLRPHQPVGNDPAVHTLITDDADPSQAVACPLPAGGVTIHQPKTLHYTGPNRTDQTRRAYILFFGCPTR